LLIEDAGRVSSGLTSKRGAWVEVPTVWKFILWSIIKPVRHKRRSRFGMTGQYPTAVVKGNFGLWLDT